MGGAAITDELGEQVWFLLLAPVHPNSEAPAHHDHRHPST